MLSSPYRHLVCHHFIAAFASHPMACYDMVAFYLCKGDSDRQSRFDRSKISNNGRQYVEEHENWSRKYSSHYFIKFVGFIPIYYIINLDIVLSCMVF